jgi:hypothetical protein
MREITLIIPLTAETSPVMATISVDMALTMPLSIDFALPSPVRIRMDRRLFGRAIQA